MKRTRTIKVYTTKSVYTESLVLDFQGRGPDKEQQSKGLYTVCMFLVTEVITMSQYGHAKVLI